MTRAYRKAGYLTMVIAGYIPANSQLAAAIATIVKSRVAQCIDKEILIRKKCNIDIGIDIDKENFEKLIIY